jgi:hypothetical protein
LVGSRRSRLKARKVREWVSTHATRYQNATWAAFIGARSAGGCFLDHD